jgi:hypothetical protein
MQLRDILVEQDMARSNSEAVNLCKQGAVRVLKAGCDGGYPLDSAQWEKVLDARTDISSGTPVVVSNGLWRCVTRNGAVGFDQLQGIGRSL